MLILACVVFSGWLFAVILGTWAYFAAEGGLNEALARKA